MTWVGRLFEERFTAVRLTIVTVSGIGYLTLVPEGLAMSPVDRWIAVAVFAFGYVAVWSPFAVVCAYSAILAAGFWFGAHDDTVPQVALAWAVFEVGTHRSGRQAWAGLAIAIAGSLLSDLGDLAVAPLTAFYGAVTMTAVPLLLGMYARTLGELNRQAAERTARELARVRAEERTSIARELHDLVAHHVASIVLRIAVARKVLPLDDPRVRQVLDDVHATGSGALADLRRLVEVLRDPGSGQVTSFVDPDGLEIALRSVVERSRQIGLTVEADIDHDIVKVDARTALAVLRLTQEGLANVAKHAGTAAKARLSIQIRHGLVAFDLTNSGGRGDPGPIGDHDAGQAEGHGLVGLRERVEVLGGWLRAGPDSSGWRLAASVPVGAGK